MWKGIVDHFKDMLPIWIVSIVIAGFSVAGAGFVAWKDMAVRDAEIQRDLVLIKCRIGIDVTADDCAFVKPFIEDVEDILADKEEEEE